MLRFGAGIDSDDLWFRRVGGNLEVSVIGTGDKAVINNWYSGTAHQIERFELDAGLALVNGQVNALVSAMAAFDPPAPGQTVLSPEQQAVLSPVITANWK